MHPTKVRLGVEQLGHRVLPSASVAALAGSAAAPAVQPLSTVATTVHSLGGTIHASLSRFTQVPADMGARYSLHGSGTFANLGSFDVKGILRGTGFIANGHATGLMTLTNSRGAITIKLEGPQQPGFAALPGRFQFTVVGASGAYHNVHATGNVTVGVHGTALQLSFT
jgi:hypothetical protein